MLEGALAAGLASVGCRVRLGGVLPTPAVAELVAPTPRSSGRGPVGLPQPLRRQRHQALRRRRLQARRCDRAADRGRHRRRAGPRPTEPIWARWSAGTAALEAYGDSLLQRFPTRPQRAGIAIDCANGATVTTARRALERARRDRVGDRRRPRRASTSTRAAARPTSRRCAPMSSPTAPPSDSPSTAMATG